MAEQSSVVWSPALWASRSGATSLSLSPPSVSHLWHRKEIPALPQSVYGKEELNRVSPEYKVSIWGRTVRGGHICRDRAYWEPSAVIILT